MAPNFCAGAYPLGKTAKALPTRGEGWRSVLRAYKTPIFLRAKNERTPLPARKSTWSRRHHYTTLTNASTSAQGQGKNNRTQSLPCLLTPTPIHATGWPCPTSHEPYSLPCEIAREHSAARQLWPSRDALLRLSDRAWSEGVPCAQRVTMRPTAGGIFFERNLRTEIISSNEEKF